MIEITEKAIEDAASRLSCYKVSEELLLHDPDNADLTLRTEQFFLRRSVLKLPQTKEKLFLYYRFIKGETMEKTAELLGISRRSVFRLRSRALRYYIIHNPPNECIRVLE